MRRERELELGQGIDVVARRPSDHDAGEALGERRLRSLSDRVDVLLSEADPKPGVDERAVGRGSDDVV